MNSAVRYAMSIEWIAGLISLMAISATVVFILKGIDIPREWWMLVMASIVAKIFGSNKPGSGNGDSK